MEKSSNKERRGGVVSLVQWLNFPLHHMIDIPALCGRRILSFPQAETGGRGKHL